MSLLHPHLHHCHRSLHFADVCEIVYHGDSATEGDQRAMRQGKAMWGEVNTYQWEFLALAPETN
jgi:hypothetical protein